jgi:hypothetical protein
MYGIVGCIQFEADINKPHDQLNIGNPFHQNECVRHQIAHDRCHTKFSRYLCKAWERWNSVHISCSYLVECRNFLIRLGHCISHENNGCSSGFLLSLMISRSVISAKYVLTRNDMMVVCLYLLMIVGGEKTPDLMDCCKKTEFL